MSKRLSITREQLLAMIAHSMGEKGSALCDHPAEPRSGAE